MRISAHQMTWRGNELFWQGSRHPVLCIEQDSTYSTMWRIRKPDGTLTNMVNRTRAKDAALLIARRYLEVSETPTEAAGDDFRRGGTLDIPEAAE